MHSYEYTNEYTSENEKAGHMEQVPWTTVDELNWKADRTVIRALKKRGEAPSDWLANEYRELSARRKASRG